MKKGRLVAAPKCYLRLYGDWFVGLSEIPFSEAFARTAVSVRPRCSPITRVGVLPFASWRSCFTSLGVQALPEFLSYLAICLIFRPLGIGKR
jgi:hypothetical protein